ncbi:NAD(P)/FAD-dependent oxidoreductase [Streptomyces sp. NPDC055105]|uniref:NAD(P)/FAD-dependent oxidoreductase n=1 Tax=Streptomyces sp. NPDC055105 TaxID=3365719 RepID=UPI0037D78018
MVILGGGFAGLFAARALRKSPVAVTVVDRRAHHLFPPLLYQCASGILSEGQIAQPLRGVLRRHHNVRCVLAEATDVDAGARLVHARRPEGADIVLPYDDLIVAVGMRQSYFGHDEFAAHAPGMKTLDDALDIRRRIYRAFEMAETAADDRERQQWLTFARGRAVVKAGPLHLSGFAGWLARLFIRLAFLTGFRSRLGAVLSWSVVFATGSRRARAFTMPGTDVSAARAAGPKAPEFP